MHICTFCRAQLQKPPLCNRIDQEQRRTQSYTVSWINFIVPKTVCSPAAANIDFRYACEIPRLYYSQFWISGNITLIQNTFESPPADETINTSKSGDQVFSDHDPRTKELYQRGSTRAVGHSRAELSAVHVPLLDIQFIKCLSLIEQWSKVHVRARKLTVLWKLTARYLRAGKTLALSVSTIKC